MRRSSPTKLNMPAGPALWGRVSGAGGGRWCAAVHGAALAVWCVAGGAAGQEAKPAPAEEEVVKQRAAWRDLLDRQPAEYRIYLDTAEKTPLSFRKVPVLRWANYTRFDALKVRDAATYIWTAQGRPEVVACAFSIPETVPTILLDFGSLSRHGLIAERNGQRAWYPKEPGVEFQPVPDAPVPAESAEARLRQMKTLAGGFTSTLVQWRDDASDREQLRMLPQPVYRYAESKNPDVLDGAMFFFVQGTDPESLLLLEAVREGSGYQWQFAFARRTSGALMAQYQQKTVWRVPRLFSRNTPTQTRIEIDHRVRAQ
jgi:hypothetical protein